MRVRARAPLAAALVLAACAARPAAGFFDGPVRVAEAPDPYGYPGLQLRVTAGASAAESFLFWPQEGVSVQDFEFVGRDQIEGLERGPDGGLRYRVGGLAAAGISFDVEVRPAPRALEIRYLLRNEGGVARFVGVAPCFQLPDAFSERRGWARAKDVLLPTAELGWRWIADTHQTRGAALKPGDPDPGRAPWSQHFYAARHDHARTPHDANPGLALFGVASEHVTRDFIAAVRRRDAAFVALASDSPLGVAYAFVNCLHAGVGRWLAPGEAAQVRLRVLFHRGDLASLLARVEAEAGPAGWPERDAGFVRPDAREEVVESFEAGAAGWRAEGGALTVGASDDPFLAPSHGGRQLVARLAPGGRIVSPPLGGGAALASAVQLSVDVALPADAAPARAGLRLLDGARTGATLEAALSPGRTRRLVVALGSGAAGRAPHLELSLPGATASATLLLDAVTLHAPASGHRGAPAPSEAPAAP